MQPRLFLTLAQELAKVNRPAECRSAISRAYYAVYNAAEAFLERMGVHKPKTNYHFVLHQRLMGSGDQEIHDLGSDLSDLHTKRLRADYHLNDKRAEDVRAAIAATEEVERMLLTLDQCPVYSERWKAIQANIKSLRI